MVNVAEILANPHWRADVPASPENPLSSRVGWLNINNVASGIFGIALGFVGVVLGSLPGKRQAANVQALIEALHAPMRKGTDAHDG